MLKKNGFTFIELITAIAIIGILATLTMVSLKTLQINARDSRRISDINEIRDALNLYYAKYNQYPTYVTPGESFQIGSLTYLEEVPSNPTPQTDGGCIAGDYTYATQNNNLSYTLSFCLGDNMADIQSGNNQATPGGIASVIPITMPTSGLVGLWKFDEGSGITAYDTGGSNNGTLANSPTWQTGASCKVGSCLQFATNQAVQINRNLSDIINGRNFTINFWVKPLVDAPDGSAVILDGETTHLNSAGCFFTPTKKIWCGITFTDGSGLGATSANNSIDLNSWQLITFVDDGVTMRIYKGKTKIAEVDSTGKTLPTKTNLKIGLATNCYAMYNSFLNGLIDEFRIYNRALSESEIGAIYDLTN